MSDDHALSYGFSADGTFELTATLPLATEPS
jgi:hypothetical protein